MNEFLQRGLRVVARLVLSACAVTAGQNPAIAAGVTRNPVAAEQARASAQAAMSASRAAFARAVRGSSRPSDVVANPFRAYPHSCLADSYGLPFGANDIPPGPAPFQTTLLLPGNRLSNDAAEQNYTETVTITLWRIPCSPDVNGIPQSAVVFEIDRPCGQCGTTSLYPTFPLVEVTQGLNSNITVRLAEDQNTWFSSTYVDSPIFASSTWVLENFYGSSVQFDFNQAFSIAFDRTFQWDVPAYNPAQYPTASQPLPISGYMTSNWYSPGHGGEGMLTQVFENPGSNPPTRTFTAAWYTFDKSGLPFWLFAQGAFDVGARTTGPVDTYYPTGGTFAGAPGPGATFVRWGTVTFSFPDCNHMAFTFNGNADAVNGPTSNGTESRTWLRIANVNSIVCN